MELCKVRRQRFLQITPISVRHNTSEASTSTVIPIAEISDEALLEQVCQGTREALGILFRRHASTVRNVAYRILRNEAEADDLVQDVFIFICRKAALFNASGGTARSWIVQVTYTGSVVRKSSEGASHLRRCARNAVRRWRRRFE